jgi:hypothetical protein
MSGARFEWRAVVTCTHQRTTKQCSRRAPRRELTERNNWHAAYTVGRATARVQGENAHSVSVERRQVTDWEQVS